MSNSHRPAMREKYCNKCFKAIAGALDRGRMGPALTLSAVTVHRGGRALLREASFDVAAGEIVALIGPNGAGKTTLLETVVGLRAHEGRVQAASLCWLPDEPSPAAELTVGHHLELG